MALLDLKSPSNVEDAGGRTSVSSGFVGSGACLDSAVSILFAYLNSMWAAGRISTRPARMPILALLKGYTL